MDDAIDKHYPRVRERGGALKSALPLIKSALYTVKVGKLDEIAKDPAVVYISPDRPLQTSLDAANPTVGARLAAQYGWTGEGVSVAVIDSGVGLQPGLQGTRGSRVIAGRRRNGDLLEQGSARSTIS